MIKRIITLIFCFATLGAVSQSGFLGASVRSYPLIVFHGDSNSQGIGKNDSALVSEIGVRSSVNIVNNNTLVFETLNIGVNNEIGGNMPADSLSDHGWELGLANSTDSGTLSSPAYIIKTGQSGATVLRLDTGAFWNAFTSRIDTAIKQLPTSHTIFMFYSEGINDCNTNVPVLTWVANTKIHIARIRAKYGKVPIFMTRMPSGSINPVLSAQYDAAIINLASDITDFYAISTSGAEINGIHWTYNGLKVLATRMIYTLKANYPIL